LTSAAPAGSETIVGRTLLRSEIRPWHLGKLIAAWWESSLGTGRRLFGSTADKTTWKLAKPKTVGEGILITVFQRADR
jgi:hypothetical protein